jgi:hypothetical protein
MVQTIKERVVIQPGGLIQIRRPELVAGSTVEVIVMLEQPAAEPAPLASFIGRGKGCFTSAAEVDAFIRSERDAWER